MNREITLVFLPFRHHDLLIVFRIVIQVDKNVAVVDFLAVLGDANTLTDG